MSQKQQQQQQEESPSHPGRSKLQLEAETWEKKNRALETCLSVEPRTLRPKEDLLGLDQKEIEGVLRCPICSQDGSCMYRSLTSCLRCPEDHQWWGGTGELLQKDESGCNEKKCIPPKVWIAYEKQRYAQLKNGIADALAILLNVKHVDLDQLRLDQAERRIKKQKAERVEQE
jgi:hypothetical protein